MVREKETLCLANHNLSEWLWSGESVLARWPFWWPPILPATPSCHLNLSLLTGHFHLGSTSCLTLPLYKRQGPVPWPLCFLGVKTLLGCKMDSLRPICLLLLVSVGAYSLVEREMMRNRDFEEDLDKDWKCFTACDISHSQDSYSGLYSGMVVNRWA